MEAVLRLEPSNSAARSLATGIMSGSAASQGAAARLSSSEASMSASQRSLARVAAATTMDEKIAVAVEDAVEAASEATFKEQAMLLGGLLQDALGAVAFAEAQSLPRLLDAAHACPAETAGLARQLLQGPTPSRVYLLRQLATPGTARKLLRQGESGASAEAWSASGAGLYAAALHKYAREGSEPTVHAEAEALQSLRRVAIPVLKDIVTQRQDNKARLAALDAMAHAVVGEEGARIMLGSGALRVLVSAAATQPSLALGAGDGGPQGSAALAERVQAAASATLAATLQRLRGGSASSDTYLRGVLLGQCQHALRSLGEGAWKAAQEEEADEAVRQQVRADEKEHERGVRRRMAAEARGEAAVDAAGGAAEHKEGAEAAEPVPGSDSDPRMSELKAREAARAEALGTLPHTSLDPLEGERVCRLLHTAFLTHPDVAEGLLLRTSFRCLLGACGRSSRPETQVAMCDLLSIVVGDKEGGGDGIVGQGMLKLLGELADADAISVKSAATVALAKLTSGSLAPQGGGGAGLGDAAAVAAVQKAAGPGALSAEEAQRLAKEMSAKAKAAAVESVFTAVRGLLVSAVELLPAAGGGRVEGTRATTEAGAGSVVARSLEALGAIIGRTSIKGSLMREPAALDALLRVLHALGHGAAVPPRKGAERGSAGHKEGQLSAAARFAALCGGSPTLLGAAFIVYALTMSVDQQRAEALSRMDLDEETWQKFQALTSGGDDSAEVADPPEAVTERVKKLLAFQEAVQDAGTAAADVAAGVVASGTPSEEPAASTTALTVIGVLAGLHHVVEELAVAAVGSDGAHAIIFGGGSGTEQRKSSKALAGRSTMVNELLARAMLGLVAPQDQGLRGRIVQLGGVGLLLSLARPKRNTGTGTLQAAQALARLLISTNPALLPQSQLLDCVGPLVALAKVQDSSAAAAAGSGAGAAQGASFDANTGSVALQRFEAAMALTNLASHSVETRNVMLAAGALSALQSLQFDGHPMVRRAATGAVSNFAATEAGRRAITGSNLKLWCAMTEAYWEDADTAVAAAGGLARATSTEYDVSERVVRSEGVQWVDSEEEADTSTKLHDAGRTASKAVLAGGGVSALTAAMLSGIGDLQHRCLVALRNLLFVPGGAKALSEPVDIDVSFADDGGGEGGDGAAQGDPGSKVTVVPLAVATAIVKGTPLPSWQALQDGQDGEGGLGHATVDSPVLRSVATELVVAAQKQLTGKEPLHGFGGSTSGLDIVHEEQKGGQAAEE